MWPEGVCCAQAIFSWSLKSGPVVVHSARGVGPKEQEANGTTDDVFLLAADREDLVNLEANSTMRTIESSQDPCR